MAQEAGGKGNKTVVILLGVVIVLLVAALGVFGAMLIKSNKTNQELQQAVEKEEKRNVVVSEDNVDQLVEEMVQQEYIEPGYYEASMNTTWTFATGSDISEDAYVANVEGNTNDVYFDVVLAEDESQVIYKSPVIPRGGELENFALDTPLEAGTYDCVCIYHLVDDDQNTISTLRVGVTIVVNQ